MIRVFLAVLLTIFLIPQSAHADIVISFSQITTGDYAALSTEIQHGVVQAIKDINNQGDILDQRLFLETDNDTCDARQAPNLARSLVSKRVQFVIGSVCPESAVPDAKVYSDSNVLMISPVTTNPPITQAGYKTVFCLCGPGDEQGTAQAEYVIKNFRDYRMAILHDDSASSVLAAQTFEKTLNDAGVREAVFDSFKPGEKDYTSLISKLSNQNGIQLLVIEGTDKDVGLIARQIKQLKAKIQIITGNSIATDQFWKSAGSGGEGVLMTSTQDVSTSADAQAAIQGLHKANRAPSHAALYGYAAVQTIVKSIKLAGYPDPARAAAILRKDPFDTAIGKISFDSKGNMLGIGYVIYRWSNGKYTQVSG